VPSLEHLDAVLDPETVEGRSEIADLVVVEVALADAAEEGERHVPLRRLLRWKAGAAADHARQPSLEGPAQAASETRAAGEPRRVPAAGVDGQPALGILQQEVDGGGVRSLRVVALRVVGAGDDEPETLGGLAKKLGGEAPAPARIERIQDRPFSFGRVAGGHEQGVGKGGVAVAADRIDDLTGAQGHRLRRRETGEQQSEERREPARTAGGHNFSAAIIIYLDAGRAAR